jgi:aryl-alcohol dehydrogenase-like predicted oxidoreductase
MSITRRRFLLGALAASVGAGIWRVFEQGLWDLYGPGRRPSPPTGGPIPKRPLGKTGVEVTMIGLGGSHAGALVPRAADAVALIQRAIDEGITFLDNAADYGNGVAEERMGMAISRWWRRDKVFLMTKCCDHGRTREGSLAGLERSLKRLRTDHLDLYQLHDITRPDDPARCFAKGGAIEALDEAKRRGLVRFVGFTGHRDPKLHLEMLSYGYPFDTVQMPLNPVDPHYRSFEREVLPVLVERGIGVIGMKSLADGRLPSTGLLTAEECIRYALSLPVSTVVCGMKSMADLAQDLAVARAFAPLDEAGRKALTARLAGVAGKGDLEWYKRL